MSFLDQVKTALSSRRAFVTAAVVSPMAVVAYGLNQIKSTVETQGASIFWAIENHTNSTIGCPTDQIIEDVYKTYIGDGWKFEFSGSDQGTRQFSVYSDKETGDWNLVLDNVDGSGCIMRAGNRLSSNQTPNEYKPSQP